MDSILFTKRIPHETIEQELYRLSRQIAVGAALRANPLILEYLTEMAEDTMQSTLDLDTVHQLNPETLKSRVVAMAAEAGVSKHLYDLVTGVETRTDAYNNLHLRNTNQEQ